MQIRARQDMSQCSSRWNRWMKFLLGVVLLAKQYVKSVDWCYSQLFVVCFNRILAISSILWSRQLHKAVCKCAGQSFEFKVTIKIVICLLRLCISNVLIVLCISKNIHAWPSSILFWRDRHHRSTKQVDLSQADMRVIARRGRLNVVQATDEKWSSSLGFASLAKQYVYCWLYV